MNRFHRWACRSEWWRQALTQKIIPWALEDVELGDSLLEVGPGPGLSTDFLRKRVARITALEIDARLASALKARMSGTNVSVVEGDATRMPFTDASFSGAVAFTMLHHVPLPEWQDRLLAEVRRVLRPGGVFVGTDSRWSRTFQLMHLFDTMVIVDPNTFGARLERAGFRDVRVDAVERAFRFRARR